MQPRRTSFVILLTENIRRRHEHIRTGRDILHFLVQIEVFHEGNWRPVVRYDTAHGFAHRDLLHPDGRIDKTPLFMRSFSEALDFAESDLRSNWQFYIDRFMKEFRR